MNFNLTGGSQGNKQIHLWARRNKKGNLNDLYSTFFSYQVRVSLLLGLWKGVWMAGTSQPLCPACFLPGCMLPSMFWPGHIDQYGFNPVWVELMWCRLSKVGVRCVLACSCHCYGCHPFICLSVCLSVFLQTFQKCLYTHTEAIYRKKNKTIWVL